MKPKHPNRPSSPPPISGKPLGKSRAGDEETYATYEYEEKPLRREPEAKSEILAKHMYEKMDGLAKTASAYAGDSLNSPAAKLFVAQAECIKDFEDSYPLSAPCWSRMLKFSDMSFSQFRCYCTWRSKARRGVFSHTQPSYAYLYALEILNNIGISDPLDGLTKLAELHHGLHGLEEVKKSVKEWIPDYYIVNNIDAEFSEVLEMLGIESLYPDVPPTSGSVADDYLIASGYSIEDSLALSKDNANVYKKCVEAAVKELEVLFSLYNADMAKMINSHAETMNWKPYNLSLVVFKKEEDRTAYIGKNRIFTLRSGEWTCTRLSSGYFNSSVLAFIMKCVESRFRDCLKITPRLSPVVALTMDSKTPKSFEQSIVCALKDENFKIMIDSAVDSVFTLSSANLPSKRLLDAFKMRPYDILRSARQYEHPSGVSAQFADQANMLSDLTDSFPGSYGIKDEFRRPCYNNFTYSQLRLYFSWRTLYRSGVSVAFVPTYVKIHAFELINRFRQNFIYSLDGLARLLSFCAKYQKNFMVAQLARWIHDFCLSRPVSIPFSKIMQMYHLELYFPSIALQSPDVEWHAVLVHALDYEVKSSIYFNEESKRLLYGGFDHVVRDIARYFENKGLSLLEFIVDSSDNQRMEYEVFQDAIYLNIMKESTMVLLSPLDAYAYDSASQTWISETRSNVRLNAIPLFGFIMRRVESNLRRFTKFRSRINARVANLKEGIISLGLNKKDEYKDAIFCAEFELAIDSSIERWYNERTDMQAKPEPVKFEPPKPKPSKPAKKVTVDLSQLDQIRKAAEQNLDKLLVNQDAQEKPKVVIPKPAPKTGSGWEAFFKELPETQLKAISAILSGEQVKQKLQKLAAEEGVLLEVMLESINDKAMDCIGDIIIESDASTFSIFDVYAKDIRPFILNF
ncbi:MAG: TerB N-terminal domain-containing protein [Clostridiales bacterium]|jgi:hypothetical protein|nr:TerB N-terminal domain-containing protein [Clostridiales bacterium]